MIKQGFVIEGEFPTTNEIIAESKKGRGRYQPYAEMKRAYTDLVGWACKNLKPMRKIDLEITWYSKDRRKDPDNISGGVKFILDGLVAAGVLENDGQKQINSISHKFDLDRDNPRVEVTLNEI